MWQFQGDQEHERNKLPQKAYITNHVLVSNSIIIQFDLTLKLPSHKFGK